MFDFHAHDAQVPIYPAHVNSYLSRTGSTVVSTRIATDTKNTTRYLVCCSKGHIRERTSCVMRLGKDCPECTGVPDKPPPLEIYNLCEWADREDGLFLGFPFGKWPSHVAKAHGLWMCAKNHIFEARVDNVKAGHWCHKCNSYEKWTMPALQEDIAPQGICCVSAPEELENGNKSILWFKCRRAGHFWKTTLTNITSRKSGCPCCRNKSEQLFREVLQLLFHDPFFPEKRLKILRYRGNILQLDCFSKQWNIAGEYNGIQHYEEVPFFGHGAAELKDQQERDAFKRRQCNKNGINFFEIRYYPKDCYTPKEFKIYILESIPENIKAKSPFYPKLRSLPTGAQQLSYLESNNYDIVSSQKNLSNECLLLVEIKL